jgi:hypothetical protein
VARASPHFSIIGISTDDDLARAKEWLKASNATINQFIDTRLQMENMLDATRIPRSWRAVASLVRCNELEKGSRGKFQPQQ